MTGLSRFDFYPRDWHLDTRDLSNAAKGVYIDLLSAMYARGGPLPMDERELCRLCGCATARSLRPLLHELLERRKLKLEHGHLVNNRAIEEIAKAERRKAIASTGGTAKAETVRAEFDSNSARTQAETRADIEEIQWGNGCSPSPSPSKKDSEEDKSSSGGAPPFGNGPTHEDEGVVPETACRRSSGPEKFAPDPKKPLFDLGREIFGKKSGGQVTRLIGAQGSDLDATMATMERARQQRSDPAEYLSAIIHGKRQPETDWDAEYRRMGVSL